MKQQNKKLAKQVKIGIVFIVLFFIISKPAPAAERANLLTIKILTLNLHNGIDMNNQSNLTRFAQLIAAEQPDIIALQEVQRNHLHHLQVSGYRSIAGPNVNCVFFRFGNALFTRHKIVYHRHHYLPGQKEQRGVDEVAIEIDGQYLRVLNTHIGLGRDEQKQQIDEISRISRYLPGPLIITGDFNLEPFHELLTDFNFNEVSSGIAFYKTYPAVQPRFHIDQIWHNDYFQSVEARPVLWQGSDHLPVVAGLKLMNAGSFPEQVAIPDPTLQHNPLLPDVEDYPAKTRLAIDLRNTFCSLSGSIQVPIKKRFSVKARYNGRESELGIIYSKTIDLRDYFSYSRMRSKAAWEFSAATNLSGESRLEWSQYYRWGNQSGSKIVFASGGQQPNWSWEQYYLPLEPLRLMIGVNGDSELTIGTAIAPAKNHTIELQYITGRTENRYSLNWNYSI